jgi:recombination protein RecT
MATKQNEKIKNQLAARTGEAPAARPKTLAEQINAMVPQFAKAMPKHMSPDRLARIALTAIRKNPTLGKCTPQSFFGSLMQCAALGLEPNLAGHAYLVPFKNHGNLEVQYITGYKGQLELVRRSGEVIGTPAARLVYENDIFELEYGMEEDTFRHVPWFMRAKDGITEPGEILGAYVRARYVKGGGDIYFQPIQKIEERRERSKAKNNGPWKTDYEAMVLKTAVRAAFPWLPMSIEDRETFEAGDERVVNIDPETLQITSHATEDDDHRGQVIEVDPTTGEITNEAPPEAAAAEDEGRPFTE